jgi:hypothetical protein
LFVLLEAFSADDLAVANELARERAGRNEQVLMGLNCRDLETLQIDFQRFAALRAPAVRVAERRGERRRVAGRRARTSPGSATAWRSSARR